MQMVMIPLAAALSLALAWTRMNAPACCVFAICARSALDMETSFSVRCKSSETARFSSYSGIPVDTPVVPAETRVFSSVLPGPTGSLP